MAAGDAYQLKFWDLNRKDQSQLNPSPRGDVAVFSADSKYAAVGDNSRITIWDVKTQRTIRVIKLPETDFIKGNPRTIRVMAFSPNNRLLAIGTPHGSIKIWDIEAEKNVTVFEAHEIGVSTLVFRPDGRVLASASWDRTIALWDVSSLNTTGKVDFDRKKGEKP